MPFFFPTASLYFGAVAYWALRFHISLMLYQSHIVLLFSGSLNILAATKAISIDFDRRLRPYDDDAVTRALALIFRLIRLRLIFD